MAHELTQPRYPDYYRPQPDHRRWWTLGCALLVLPISLFAMMCFIFSSDFLGMDERSPKAMMEGFALKPHVYRQLIPALTRGIVAVTPVDMRTSLTDSISAELWSNKLFVDGVRLRHRNGKPIELDDDRLYPFAIICILDYAFLLGYAYMLWLLARQVFPNTFSIHIMAPVFGLLALPPFCGKYGYIYDFPVLFFSAWLMLLMARQRWLAYGIVFAVATFNKESTIYVMAAFFFYGLRALERRDLVFLLAVQVLIFVTIKWLLALAYQGTGGALLEFRGVYGHLRANFDGYSVYTFWGLVAALSVFTYRLEEKPMALKCWLPVVPFTVLAWLMFGNRNEYRVFYDVFPALTMLGCHTLATALQWKSPEKNKRPH